MNVVSLRARSCMGFFANPLHYYQPSESQKVKSRYAKLPKKVVQKSPFPQVITGDRGIGDKKNCAAIHIVAQLLFNFHLGVKYILSLVYSLL